MHLNADAMRDLGALEREYGKLADEGWFVRGTTCEAVVYHELGHNLERCYNVDSRKLAGDILGVENDVELESLLDKGLSRYASKHLETEIPAEAVAGWLSGIGNEFADAFMGRVLQQ